MTYLRNVEIDVLQAIREVVGTYQKYSENYNDEKYLDIKEHFILPLVGKTDSLITAFEEIGIIIKELSDEGVVSES